VSVSESNHRPFLGSAALLRRSALAELARALNGLPVLGCLPDGPAERAGLRYGDVLLTVDGRTAHSWSTYLAAPMRTERAVHVRLFREGREVEVSLTLRREARYTIERLAAAIGVTGDDELDDVSTARA
jgi:S1-C subfamily serine protease